MKQFMATALLMAPAALVSGAPHSTLPIVNLGYEQHQAINFNQSAQTYNFSNIRYANPPVGDLRFRAPVPAWTNANSSKVDDGSIGRTCYQANPVWQSIIVEQWLPKYFYGQPFNGTAEIAADYANETAILASQPNDGPEGEDCLFLDVVAPKDIFDKADNAGGAPVLVWIYGGGFVEGDKTDGGRYNPYGLLERAQASSGEKFIYVAFNYRLGVFGWLAGPSLQKDGTANAGLYDQRLALEWVQKYIHLFGGDPSRVTIMGESAGGGSVLHQIAAFNGEKGSPFAQAIPQSPAFQPIQNASTAEDTYSMFLKKANVTSLSELRNLSTDALRKVNTQVITQSPYGTLTFGPVVDGIISQMLPGKALASGNFDKNIRVLAGHNADEGIFFTAPNATDEAGYLDMLHDFFPNSPSSFFDEVNALYPQVYNGSYPYKTPIQRDALTIGEFLITCNTYFLGKALANRTYSYQFDVIPAIHGEDLSYTFAYNSTGLLDPNVATILQEYITSFAITGNPNAKHPLPGVLPIPVYGSNNSVVDLAGNTTYLRDSNANPRCDFWQKALY